LGNLRFPLRNPETKCHLGASPMAKHKIYYKGKGGGFPQVQAVVSFVSSRPPVAHPSTKSVLAMHYQLVVWFCAGSCELLMLVIFPSPHPKTSTHPFTLKVL
jgi:hypothetical protein